MRCQYCDKRLGITKLLKGENFCSSEHQEAFLEAGAKAAFDRLMASADYTYEKVKPVKVEEKLEPEPVNLIEDPPAAVAAPENEPSSVFEIAALADAVERTSGSELREARVEDETPAVAEHSESLHGSYASELIPAAMPSPVSQLETSSRIAPTRIVDVSPVSRSEPSIEAMPDPSQVSWPEVPPGYPPMMVSPSATLVVDPNGADLIPMSMGKPCPGSDPIRLPQAHAIETPPQYPLLPSWQTQYAYASERSTLFEHPHQDSPYDVAWVARLGSGYNPPALESFLTPQGEMLRFARPKKQSKASPAGLPIYNASFMTVAPNIFVPAAELPPARAAYLPASLIPLNTFASGHAQTMTNTWALEIAPRQPMADAISPVGGAPPLVEISSAWQQTAITSQIPLVPHLLAPAPTGLDLATELVPLEPSIATTAPPAVETAAAVAGTHSFLLLQNPAAMAGPVMPLSDAARPLENEACALPVPLREQADAPSLANLHPSLPSPWSLVNWSHSLAISVPACKPSDLSKSAEIGLSARQGSVEALAPSSPNRRGQRLAPLKPAPSDVFWTPTAPIDNTPRALPIAPMHPGTEGTEPPALAAAKAQPASMPVRPRSKSLFGKERGIGPLPSGPAPEETRTLVGAELADEIWKTACEFLPEWSTALPRFSFERRAFSIAQAPSSQKIEWFPIAPDQPDSTVELFSAVKRSPRSTIACLPGTLELQAAHKANLDLLVGKWHQV